MAADLHIHAERFAEFEMTPSDVIHGPAQFVAVFLKRKSGLRGRPSTLVRDNGMKIMELGYWPEPEFLWDMRLIPITILAGHLLKLEGIEDHEHMMWWRRLPK